MKYTLVLAVIIVSSLNVFSQSQTFDCPDIVNSQTLEEAFITFSGVTCNDMGNMDPNDDVITFTVSGENGNSSQSIEGFPVWPPTIEMNSFLDLDDMEEILNIWAGNEAFSEQVMAISPGCAPLNLTLQWGLSATGCEAEIVTLEPAIVPIPTLGQWALISLAFILAIMGLVTIKSRNKQLI